VRRIESGRGPSGKGAVREHVGPCPTEEKRFRAGGCMAGRMQPELVQQLLQVAVSEETSGSVLSDPGHRPDLSRRERMRKRSVG